MVSSTVFFANAVDSIRIGCREPRCDHDESPGRYIMWTSDSACACSTNTHNAGRMLMLVWRSREKRMDCSLTIRLSIVSVSMTLSEFPALSRSLMTDVVVAERLNQGSEARQGEQLHVAFFQHERDLELLDADLGLLNDCLGDSGICTTENTAAA
jgi:hypothetical protein